MVFHRGQPAHSGRAHRHRNGDRHRPRALADPHRPGTRRSHGPEINLPPQDQMPLHGYALQCRVTTEDPQNNFVPDYGKIHTYRSPAGFGVRLDGGSAYGGAVITPVLRLAARQGHGVGPRVSAGVPAHGSRAARVPHSRRQDQHPVPRERRQQRRVPVRPARRRGFSTRIRRCSQFTPRQRPRDEAPDLHRRRHRQRQSGSARQDRCRTRFRPAPIPRHDASAPPAGTRQLLDRTRPGEIRRVDVGRRSGCC